MNDFANTSNSSALLKDDYTPVNAMKQAIINRKRKLIEEGSAAPQDEYNSKDPELEEKK